MNQIQTADYKLQFKQQKDSVRVFFKNTIVFYRSYLLKNHLYILPSWEQSLNF